MTNIDVKLLNYWNNGKSYWINLEFKNCHQAVVFWSSKGSLCGLGLSGLEMGRYETVCHTGTSTGWDWNGYYFHTGTSVFPISSPDVLYCLCIEQQSMEDEVAIVKHGSTNISHSSSLEHWPKKNGQKELLGSLRPNSLKFRMNI